MAIKKIPRDIIGFAIIHKNNLCMQHSLNLKKNLKTRPSCFLRTSVCILNVLYWFIDLYFIDLLTETPIKLLDFNIGVQQNLVNLNYHYIIIIFDPGILSFSGCMAVNFGDHSKGWAFYLCLTASCYIILQVILSTAPSSMWLIALPLRKIL